MLAIFFQRKRALILRAHGTREGSSPSALASLNVSEKRQDRNGAASLTRGQTVMRRDKALQQVKVLRRNRKDEILKR